MNAKTMQKIDDDFDKLVKSTFGGSHDLLGYDLFQRGPFWAKEAKYPPHDVVDLGDDSYRIDVAVAGFDRDDIEVTVADDVLRISAETTTSSKEDSVPDYIHRGIARRAFMQQFRIPQYAEIDNCELTNGILSITIVKKIPEEKLPKKVKIN